MDLKITKDSGKRITVIVENEDYSVPDIIHQELLKNRDIIFAGVSAPHPLLKQYMITLEVKPKLKPLSILDKSSISAVEKAHEVLNEANKAIQGMEK
jgi:DNA-directed RNA polymerase subunit L